MQSAYVMDSTSSVLGSTFAIVPVVRVGSRPEQGTIRIEAVWTQPTSGHQDPSKSLISASPRYEPPDSLTDGMKISAGPAGRKTIP